MGVPLSPPPPPPPGDDDDELSGGGEAGLEVDVDVFGGGGWLVEVAKEWLWE